MANLKWMSDSKLKKYEHCPEAYRFRYMVHEPFDIDIKRALGIIIHSMLHQSYTKKWKSQESFCKNWWWRWNRVRDDEDSRMGHVKITDRKGNLITDEIVRRIIFGKYNRVGWDMLELFWYLHINEPKKPLCLEKHFRLNLDGVPVQGVIDRIDETPDGKGVYITDYKTDRKIPSVDDLHLRKNPQFTLYRIAAKTIPECQGKEVRAVFFHHLRSGNLIETPRTPLDEEELVQRFKKTYDAILNDQFNLRTGPHCPYCDYYNPCRMKQAQRYLSDGFTHTNLEDVLGSSVVYVKKRILKDPKDVTLDLFLDS